MTREERLFRLGIKTTITSYARVHLNDVTLGHTNAIRQKIAGRSAYRIRTPMNGVAHSDVDLYDAARIIEDAALTWLSPFEAALDALQQIAEPPVIDTLTQPILRHRVNIARKALGMDLLP